MFKRISGSTECRAVRNPKEALDVSTDRGESAKVGGNNIDQKSLERKQS